MSSIPSLAKVVHRQYDGRQLRLIALSETGHFVDLTIEDEAVRTNAGNPVKLLGTLTVDQLSVANKFVVTSNESGDVEEVLLVDANTLMLRRKWEVTDGAPAM
ncbi:MAG: hypothetical protein KDB23_17365 [Planctomycetales bacterium]|nr:hypothetical protein [Planctomycetales bacterium]